MGDNAGQITKTKWSKTKWTVVIAFIVALGVGLHYAQIYRLHLRTQRLEQPRLCP